MAKPLTRRDKRAAKKLQPAMNVTPLVDVVLVLLIIFMVVIPAMENGVAIELPAIFHVDEDAKGRTDPVVLSLAADGSYYVEKERVSKEELREKLRAIHAQDVMRRLILRGDRGVKYVRARELFAVCQEIGFPGVSLQVNAATEQGRPGGAEASARADGGESERHAAR
jgi:biopolymer transport protein ExbD/biopolymer transport protein TolR